MTYPKSWWPTRTGCDMKGQIRRRGERSWELRFDLGADPGTGRRRLRYASFKGSKRDAEIELARLISENAAGTGVDPSKATISEFLDRWDRDWAACNVQGKTLERYRDIIALYIKPHLGAVRIQKLRPVQLNELYSKLLRRGGKGGRPLSPSTVGYVHRVLHHALGHAATWGVVPQNVASVVKPPKPTHVEIKILTEDQIRTLLDHVDGRTLRPIVSFLLGTGCRRGEARPGVRAGNCRVAAGSTRRRGTAHRQPPGLGETRAANGLCTGRAGR